MLFELFDWTEEDANKWMSKYGPMEVSPAYLCLMLDKLVCGLVITGISFMNDNAIKDKSIGAFELEPCYKAAFAFNKTLQKIKDAVDSDKAWDNYPPSMESMFWPHRKPQLE